MRKIPVTWCYHNHVSLGGGCSEVKLSNWFKKWKRFGLIRPKNLYPHLLNRLLITCLLANSKWLFFFFLKIGILLATLLCRPALWCIQAMVSNEQLHAAKLWISPAPLPLVSWLLLWVTPPSHENLARELWLCQILFIFKTMSLMVLHGMFIAWDIIFITNTWLIFFQNFVADLFW